MTSCGALQQKPLLVEGLTIHSSVRADGFGLASVIETVSLLFGV